MRSVIAYTDGSCQKNPGGPGAWAVVLIENGGRREFSGQHPSSTTSNRMEITAAIEALRALGPTRCAVLIHSDSTYLVNGASQWIKGWKRRGWRRKDGKSKQWVPVLNVDLWLEVDRLCDLHWVTWKYVPGHAGSAENNRCDYLAGVALRQCV